MNVLLDSILSQGFIEHLAIDKELKILEASSGVSQFADIPAEVKPGQDARIAFPELVGLEGVIDAIRRGEESSFKIKGIWRSLDNQPPLYIDIYITRNVNSHYDKNDLIVFVLDATERMLLEQSLVQSANEANLLLRNLTASKRYIDRIISSIPDALLVTTPSGKIKQINPAAEVLLEYDEEELIGKSIPSVIKELERISTLLPPTPYSLFPVPPNKEIETFCESKNGKIIPIAISCSIVQTDIEHFQGYIYILRDVTERKQAELAKQEFLAMITHEVRTPITSVTGMASLLLNSKLTYEQREFVETIYTSGESLLKIVNDFLDFSKIESGKLELETQPFNLRCCIHEALYLLAPKAKEKGIKLVFLDTPEIPAQVLGDITRLRQILINLISNAIKFTELGSIEISLQTRLKNILNQSLYEIEFAVKDTGIGIKPENLERLFKAFSQVNSSITRQYGGTGLGLAICKKLTELMGGRIWVESQVGIGSTFYFTITAPAIAFQLGEKNISSVAEIKADMAKEYPLRILLVEDNAINQKMIRLMLQRMGYKPSVAANGLEALFALRRQPYDVVLMDVQMPEMDGLTATEFICQEWKASSRPRIIALTASAMWGERDRCLASGMDDYLAKPIRIKELMEILKKYQRLCEQEIETHKEVQNVFTQNPKSSSAVSPQDKIQNPKSKIQNLIDSSALKEILQMAEYNPSVNPIEFLVETIDYYLEEAPILLQDMQVALSKNNSKNLKRAAHTLYSTSATLGANNLALMCQELELIATSENLSIAADKILIIEAEYKQVKMALFEERLKL